MPNTTSMRKKLEAKVIPIEKIWISKAELQQYLDVSNRWIEEAQNSALILFFKVERKIWFLKSDIDKFIQTHRVI